MLSLFKTAPQLHTNRLRFYDKAMALLTGFQLQLFRSLSLAIPQWNKLLL